MKLLVHAFHSGYGNAGTVLGRDVEVVVLRPARRRQVGVADAAVAADGHRVRPRKPLLRCGPRHPAEAPTQLVGQSLRRRCTPAGNLPSSGSTVSGCAVRASATARLSISSASMSPGSCLEVGQQPAQLGQQTRASVAAIQPSATPASTRVSALSSRADSSFSRYSASRSLDGEHCSATPHVSVLRVQSRYGRRIRNVDEVERRAQAEVAVLRRSPAARPRDVVRSSATAVTAQLRSTAIACASESSDMRVGSLRRCRYWRTSSTRTR